MESVIEKSFDGQKTVFLRNKVAFDSLKVERTLLENRYNNDLLTKFKMIVIRYYLKGKEVGIKVLCNNFRDIF